MTTALRTHYAEISKHFDGADGSLTVEAVARRSGIMRYRSDSGDRLELVPPDLIDARDESGRPIMGMLAGAPNTNEHPAQVIRYSTDSRKAVQVGKVSEEIHIYSDADGERSVKVRFDVSDPETIADIRNGRKTGVSLGYLCNVVPEIGEYRGQAYTHRQAMPFSIDHLAIVANPRNPGAIITRFDSDDVAWLSDESKVDSVAMPIVRVDACCAACSGSKDPDEVDDEPKAKKKKVKTDAEDLTMIAVTFADRVHELSIPQAQALWVDGTIDRVRMDGEDYFMASDVALALANQGLIHEDAFVKKFGVAKGGGKCGRGWVGVKGSCKRLAKGSDRAGAQKAALKDFASADRTRKQLMNAFKVENVADLSRILPKTNMKSKDELTHAVGVAWNYSDRYGVKDRSALKSALESLDKTTQSKVALEAKNGFGSTTPAPIARQSSAARKVKAKVKSETEGLKKIGMKKLIPKSPEEGVAQMKAEMGMKSKARSRRASKAKNGFSKSTGMRSRSKALDDSLK